MSVATCRQCAHPLAVQAQFCVRCGAKIEQGIGGWQASVPERLATALGPEYEVIGELGRGGFAVVYSARDRRQRRYIAVKVMRPDLLDSHRLKERFHQEAQLVSQLDHPNILPVLFTGKGAGLAYYAMPRVRGVTLQDQVRRESKLPISDAVGMLSEVARGLDHAHDRGIVHRDIKPANIMLERTGRVRILDFGVAKALVARRGHISLTGEIVGSAEYMSPEQASGSGTIDARCDIYSMGVVGFEMLAGQLPFTGDTVQRVLAQHMEQPPPDVRERRPEVPESLALSLLRCMQKSPSERWPTAVAAVRAAGTPA